jgi:hypothetical protein
MPPSAAHDLYPPHWQMMSQSFLHSKTNHWGPTLILALLGRSGFSDNYFDSDKDEWESAWTYYEDALSDHHVAMNPFTGEHILRSADPEAFARMAFRRRLDQVALESGTVVRKVRSSIRNLLTLVSLQVQSENHEKL